MQDNKETISNLHTWLQHNWQQAGFEEETQVQQQAIPLILEGQDIFMESPTGTGKTLAYVLPLLHKIDPEIKNVQALILAPTRELVMQIHQVMERFTKGSSIVTASFIGGADIKRQLEVLKKRPQIIVGTIQRIDELIKRKKLKMHQVKAIVADEVDQLISNAGMAGLHQLIKTTLRDRQLIFCSATIPASVLKEATAIMQDPQLVRIATHDVPQGQVEHLFFECEQREKIDYLRRIIRDEQVKALIFVQNNPSIDSLAAKLQYMNLSIDILYGDAHKTERAKVLQRMQQNKVSALLVSDIAARGLDIEGVTHVIHYDLPREEKQYLHRSGRTGRMGADGTVISLCTKPEVNHLLRLTKKLQIKVTEKKYLKGNILDRRSSSFSKPKKKPTHSSQKRKKSKSE